MTTLRARAGGLPSMPAPECEVVHISTISSPLFTARAGVRRPLDTTTREHRRHGSKFVRAESLPRCSTVPAASFNEGSHLFICCAIRYRKEPPLRQHHHVQAVLRQVDTAKREHGHLRIPSLLMRARALATVRVWKKRPEHQAHSRSDIRDACGLPVATGAEL